MPKTNQFNFQLLDDILSKFNLHTKNYVHYLQAFTHSSYANEHNCRSNERMEFLGDALLNEGVGEFIYHKYSDMPEGKMTKIRAAYVCEDANYIYATTLGIEKLILFGVGAENEGARKNKSIVADAFECFLCATYFTFNHEAVISILKEVSFPLLDKCGETPFVDYKSRLQEYIQADHDSQLEYITIKEEGKPNDKTFTVQVQLDKIALGTGIGKSKKQAGQEAAKAALEKMVK